MKSIQRSLLVSIIPLLCPMTAFAEPSKEADLVKPIPGAKGHSASWRASQVIGLDVKNSAKESIGKVEDLVISMNDGEILAVVISSGGFLGIADTLSAVPVKALRYDVAAKAFTTSLTKEQLTRTPQFKSDAWPDYSDAASADTLRSNRDSTGGEVVDPDNTARNEKEMDKGAANPTDQGNSKSDVDVTQKIRSAIMDTDMSFNAKNIKIITRNGVVILKGVVKSTEEHEAVLKIARTHGSSEKIIDDLKVNSN